MEGDAMEGDVIIILIFNLTIHVLSQNVGQKSKYTFLRAMISKIVQYIVKGTQKYVWLVHPWGKDLDFGEYFTRNKISKFKNSGLFLFSKTIVDTNLAILFLKSAKVCKIRCFI